ncbi:CvpA family protein [Cryomorpha ignava]|uniref:CvpA family protein n=1 Tax=Cryomorpha ignava TaxID=101383 RepID=A0A7K3WTA6_9FLAO|nr:CvpA family protein [Cryomorpha ignava]NEN24778.1 CvpA family protein [Cryomorpha ignava]
MYLDLIIAIPILWGMYRGFKRGLIIELCTLMALVLGIYGAAAFGDMAGEYLQAEFNTDPRMSLVLAFSIVFILIVIVVFIFGKVLEGVIKMVALGLVNKLFGLLFGALKFALIVSGLFFILNGFPLTDKLISPKWKQESLLYKPISSIAPKLFPILHDRSWMDEIEKRFEDLKENVEGL